MRTNLAEPLEVAKRKGKVELDSSGGMVAVKVLRGVGQKQAA